MTMPDQIRITHQPRTMTMPGFRALCAELLQAWQFGDDIAGPMNRARAALKAEPEGEGPSLQWTDNMPPSEACRYDHCIAETPFGRFLITWKSWKEYDSLTVDETPWGDWYAAFNSVDEAKAACQQGMNERLTRCGTPATPPAPEVGGGTDHVEQLAAIIRKVDGNRSMGAAALAEAILERYPCAFLVDPLDTPPAPVPGEVGELVEWLNQVAQYLVDNGVTGAPHVQGAAILLEQQEAELAALRGVPVAELDDQRREAVHQAVAEALGTGAYDCHRVWEAWGVGTMGPDDFVPVAEDSDRVAEIADAAIDAIRAIPLPAPQAGEVEA